MKSLQFLLTIVSLFVCGSAISQSFTPSPNGDAVVEGKDIYCIAGATVLVEGARNSEQADIKLLAGAGCSSSQNGKIYLNSPTIAGSNFQVNGNIYGKNKIYAKRIEVTESVPSADYVFENDYHLLPLDAVESYVQENKHLPDVPSAVQFRDNGYDIGEMDGLLLRKVEELTLYIIQQEKRIRELESSR